MPNNMKNFTQPESERPAASRGKCDLVSANAKFNTPRELLAGFTILFETTGVVLEGKKRGKELGFPTANISGGNSVPAGIYAGKVILKGKTYPAAIYKSGEKDFLEAHILDFSRNIYGETITIVAEKKIRDSKFFADNKELIAAISKDIEDIKKLSMDGK